jgi:hypothetical protein
MEKFPQNNQIVEKIEKEVNEVEKIQIKEGVDFVFEQYPDLLNIGTKEEYSQYLETIFPESKTRDILYHGTRNNFESFSKEYLGTNTGSPSAFNGFFFASSKETSLSYIGKQVTEYNQEYLNYRNQYKILMLENEEKQKAAYEQLNTLWDRRKSLLNKIIDSVKGIDVKKFYEAKAAELDSLREQEKELWEKNYLLDKTLGGYAKLVGREVEEFYDTSIKPDENTRILAVLLDIKNPGIHDDENQGYRQETYNNRTLQDKSEGKDGSVIKNTKDFSIFVSKPALFGKKEIKEDTDVYVVYEPDQIHILGSKSDIEKFKEFVDDQKIGNESHS